MEIDGYKDAFTLFTGKFYKENRKDTAYEEGLY